MALNKLLQECLLYLPISNSIIPLFIIATTIDFDREGKDLTLKNLYTALHFYSDVGIKKHLMDLAEKGWISVTPSETDGRVKKINGTDKLHSAYSKLPFIN
jgi:hypothetical protein